MRTKPVILLFGWLLTAASAAAAAGDGIPWARDLNTAQETAAREKRLLLLHFWTPDCAPCQTVERYVFPHPEVNRAVRANYVPVYINGQMLPDVAKKYGVDRYPTDVIVSTEGEVLSRTVSPKDATQYVALLNRVAAPRSAGQQKWGELAPSTRHQTPAYQANQYPPRALQPNDNFVTPGNTQPSPSRTGRMEGPSGPAQFGAPPVPGGQLGTVANPYLSGKGTNAQTGNPYVEMAANQPGNPADQFAERRADPPSATGTLDPRSQFVANSEYRQNYAPQANSRPVDEAFRGGGEFKTGGESAAPEWQENPNAAAPRTGAAGDARSIGSLAQRGPEYRQVTTETPVAPLAKADKPLALGGYCPVSLVQSQQWQKGTSEFGAIHRGRTYLFAGPREQAAFLADPDRFSPVLSGYDPVRFLDSSGREFVDGKRQHGVFYQDQIFLFADEASLARFWQAPDNYAKSVHVAMMQNAVGNRRR